MNMQEIAQRLRELNRTDQPLLLTFIEANYIMSVFPPDKRTEADKDYDMERYGR